MKMSSAVIHWTPELYDKIARYYDWMARLLPIARKGHEKVLEGLGEGALIDVACGTGTLLDMALDKGLKGYGLDTSSGMLTQAIKKVPKAQFVKSSFYEIPYPEESFDYVVETNAVSGIDIDVEKVLGEMIRVCKSGGEIRMADYTKPASTTKFSRFFGRVLQTIGDFAYDYKEYFKVYGYEPEVQVLGWGGMYQFLRVVKV